MVTTKIIKMGVATSWKERFSYDDSWHYQVAVENREGTRCTPQLKKIGVSRKKKCRLQKKEQQRRRHKQRSHHHHHAPPPLSEVLFSSPSAKRHNNMDGREYCTERTYVRRACVRCWGVQTRVVKVKNLQFVPCMYRETTLCWTKRDRYDITVYYDQLNSVLLDPLEFSPSEIWSYLRKNFAYAIGDKQINRRIL